MIIFLEIFVPVLSFPNVYISRATIMGTISNIIFNKGRNCKRKNYERKLLRICLNINVYIGIDIIKLSDF